jgi:hypothetical protein
MQQMLDTEIKWYHLSLKSDVQLKLNMLITFLGFTSKYNYVTIRNRNVNDNLSFRTRSKENHIDHGAKCFYFPYMI